MSNKTKGMQISIIKSCHSYWLLDSSFKMKSRNKNTPCNVKYPMQCNLHYCVKIKDTQELTAVITCSVLLEGTLLPCEGYLCLDVHIAALISARYRTYQNISMFNIQMVSMSCWFASQMWGNIAFLWFNLFLFLC